MGAPPNRRLDPGPAAGERIGFSFNGTPMEGRRGDTVASALLAAGVDIFARSLKYHRPRGPFCLAGRCSHCLVRLDGVPDVVACTTPLAAGMQIAVQNAFPSAKHDVLAALDWLFPRGLDHHAMFAGVPLVQDAVAAVARRVAGFGPLPDRAGLPGERMEARRCDLAIVGAGPAGLALAHALRSSGRSVELVEERFAVGGRLCSGTAAEPSGPDLAWAERTAAECAAAAVRLSLGTTALAAYREREGRALLLRSGTPARLTALWAGEIALCNGAVEPLWPFEGNDLPGIFAGRALARFIREQRVLPGERAVVAGSGPEALELALLLARSGLEGIALVGPREEHEAPGLRLFKGFALRRAEGHPRIAAVEILGPGGAVERLPCDLLALVGPVAPAIELARQAGAAVAFDEGRGGYFVRAHEGITAAEGIFAAGDVTGAGTASRARAAGEALGRALALRSPAAATS